MKPDPGSGGGSEDHPPPHDPGLDIELLRRRRERTIAVLAAIVVLGAALGTAFYLFRTKPLTTAETIRLSHDAVREAMGTQLAYQFSPDNETDVQTVATDTYVINASTVAVTREGQTQSFLFNCTIGRRQDGKWGVLKLSITQQ